MSRPTKEKKIGCHPGRRVFRPAGVPIRKSEIIRISLEEFEAIRLADVEGLRHEEAAEKMGTSRPTLNRILNSARKKVGTALTESRPLVVEGGNVSVEDVPEATCCRCDMKFREPAESTRTWNCPRCGRAGTPRNSRPD
ncbi:MAG: DUF134 domain-containing protein [Acidobacteriota bacterium]